MGEQQPTRDARIDCWDPRAMARKLGNAAANTYLPHENTPQSVEAPDDTSQGHRAELEAIPAVPAQ